MKLYLAGPMTGIPQFNFPAFAEATAALRALGHEVISPAEQDPPEVQAAALASPDGRLDANGMIAGKTWGDILALDVKTVADDVEGVVLLPGWQLSRGARLETFVALLCRKPVHLWLGGEMHWLSPVAAQCMIHDATLESVL